MNARLPAPRRFAALLLLALFAALPALADRAREGEYQDWGEEPLGWFDIERNSARAAFLYREPQRQLWLANPDRSALRATVGSIALTRFLVDEELRLVAEGLPDLWLRFHFRRHEEYRRDLQEDRLEMEYRGLPGGLLVGMLGSARFRKEDMDVGFLLGWHGDSTRYVRAHWNARRWLYNGKNRQSGTMEAFPHQFELEGRTRLGGGWEALVEGRMELPSRIRYARPELAEERLGQRRREWSGSARLWRAQAGWLYGLRGQAGWDHVAERLRVVQASGADTVVESRSLSKGSWTVKPFAAHWFGDWMVEADLPLRREWELRKDSTSTGWSERELVALELWPQAALRRYWSLLGARPFAELFSQVGLRFVQQEGGEAGAREADYANWRAGGSVGFRFLGGVDGAGRPRPRGEFRMRVMQHLDRSWYTSFGGGNILLVIAW